MLLTFRLKCLHRTIHILSHFKYWGIQYVLYWFAETLLSSTNKNYIKCSILKSICVHCIKLQYVHYPHSITAYVCLFQVIARDIRKFSSLVGQLIRSLFSILSFVVVSWTLWNHGWSAFVQQPVYI